MKSFRPGKPAHTRGLHDNLRAAFEFYEALGLEYVPVPVPMALQTASSPSAARKPRASRVSSVNTANGGSPRLRPQRASGSNNAALLQKLREEIGDCVRCKLSEKRKKIVFGEGNPEARLFFIGEAPGRDEDAQGRPFVGEAGMLLTKLIEKMGLKRTDVYIGNIIKCRPPMNRDPEPDEVSVCRAFIEKQVDIIAPEIIVTLGRIALQTLMENPSIRITAARGSFIDFRGIPVMPTFHPAYLLRNPKDKWLTWADMQQVMKRLSA